MNGKLVIIFLSMGLPSLAMVGTAICGVLADARGHDQALAAFCILGCFGCVLTSVAACEAVDK